MADPGQSLYPGPEALCAQVARCLPTTCHPILLVDRGFTTARLFRCLDALAWDWIIGSKGRVGIRWSQSWRPWVLLGNPRPAQLDGLVDYGKRARGGSYFGRLMVYGAPIRNHGSGWAVSAYTIRPAPGAKS